MGNFKLSGFKKVLIAISAFLSLSMIVAVIFISAHMCNMRRDWHNEFESERNSALESWEEYEREVESRRNHGR